MVQSEAKGNTCFINALRIFYQNTDEKVLKEEPEAYKITLTKAILKVLFTIHEEFPDGIIIICCITLLQFSISNFTKAS